MELIKTFYPVLFLLILLPAGILFSSCQEDDSEKSGAYYTGKYQNLFTELIGKRGDEVSSKINDAYDQLFHGDADNQKIYFEVKPDMAYMLDLIHNDVRSEGMSYGMMISVQLNKKEEFNRLWKWAVTFMQHKGGQRDGYFAWHTKPDGTKLDSNSASDGEIWFATSLFFASARWGDGEGIFNYKAQAQKILDAMLSKTEYSDDPKVVTNMFNKNEKQVVFVPAGEADDFTDPSYHVPHYYELWALWADKENEFWKSAAETSREFFKKTVNPNTGLAPDYSHFDGKGYNPWNGGTHNFQYDAWRVAMNIAVDYQWFAKDKWAVEQSNRLLDFFYKQGIDTYPGLYSLDGKQLTTERNAGLIEMNAVATLASTNKNRIEFVKRLWDMEIPSGHGRYYDGCLYVLAMLQLSGNFIIYEPK